MSRVIHTTITLDILLPSTANQINCSTTKRIFRLESMLEEVQRVISITVC
jgi:hypothetical protein